MGEVTTMGARNYRDLIVWQKALALASWIYKETALSPIEERYGITLQLRKASVSVSSNIAEGEGRDSEREFRHHLSIARGSLREIERQVLLSAELGYLKSTSADAIMALADEVGRLIRGL
jgi:four helix bundle protein